MNDMETIITQARELGKQIAAHPRATLFFNAAKAVSEDKAAQDILREYQENLRKLQEQEQTGKPIEPEQKRKLADLQTKAAGDDKIKLMMKHQADYLELMHRINGAIDEASQALAK
jgi:cell fate (sporulation/competence/biofilm development) regulator YlbF (YheA/YmcA/DUF963 family)